MVRGSSKGRRETEEKKVKRFGKIEGAKETKMEVVKKMLKENFNINIIKKITNATDEEIEQARTAK